MVLLLKVSLSNELKTLIIVSHDIATAVSISNTVFILGEQAGIPGATVRKEIDLIERDLARHTEVKKSRCFVETVDEIKACL